MTKTKAAFLLTAERLFERKERVFFWTFTFAVVHDDWEAAAMFSSFLNHLRKTIGGDWGGVRVAELHRNHGVHFHALVDRRLAVDIVRRVARCHGIGRINVRVADENAAPYLSKYLSKQVLGPKTKTGRSMRRWAAFGPIVKTRVRDLVNDSPEWVFRREHNMGFLNYYWETYLRHAWNRGEAEFKAAWFAAKNERLGDVIGIVHGSLRVDATGILSERMSVGRFIPGVF